MQQIYKKAPKPKCDFNKAAKPQAGTFSKKETLG